MSEKINFSIRLKRAWCFLFGHKYRLPIYKPRRSKVLVRPNVFCERCGKKYPTVEDYTRMKRTKKYGRIKKERQGKNEKANSAGGSRPGFLSRLRR